jgi:hypothetical protein
MSEAIYDEKIAPMLAEVSKLCQVHDVPMFAVVEYEPGHFGETACQTPKQSLALSMTHMASRARGNLDSFVISLLRFCNKQGIDTSASFVANRMTGNAGVSGLEHQTFPPQTPTKGGPV